ncbi:MAG: hypothetical protein HY053_02815 [Proteobacteria bacterium]|nr:hypothetical protein [Pseudomonadota bacterium]
MTMSHARRAASVLGEFYNYKGVICQVIGAVEMDNRLQLILDQCSPNNVHGMRVPDALKREQSLNQKRGIGDKPMSRFLILPPKLKGIPRYMAGNYIAVEANYFERNAEKTTAPVPSKHAPPRVSEHVLAPIGGRKPALFIGMEESYTPRLVGRGEGLFTRVTGIFLVGRQLGYRVTVGAHTDATSHLRLVPKYRGRAAHYFDRIRAAALAA